MAKTFNDNMLDAINFGVRKAEKEVKTISDSIEKNMNYVNKIKELIIEVIKSYDFFEGYVDSFHTETINFFPNTSVSARLNLNSLSLQIFIVYDSITFVQDANGNKKPSFKVYGDYDYDVIASILSQFPLEDDGIIHFYEKFNDNNPEGCSVNGLDLIDVSVPLLFKARSEPTTHTIT